MVKKYFLAYITFVGILGIGSIDFALASADLCADLRVDVGTENNDVFGVSVISHHLSANKVGHLDRSFNIQFSDFIFSAIDIFHLTRENFTFFALISSLSINLFDHNSESRAPPVYLE
ncbi:MAG: hypothetical protein HQK53_06990 [Oligoflexia bacterium]|nr:hypothetical protein [Oligoflexia bacterium]